jgi:hypothetical protein
MFVAILVIGFVLLAVIALANRSKGKLNKEAFKAQWQQIEKLREQGGAGWQLAILEADKLLDQALRQSGYSGQTMGERLKSARKAFKNVDHVWQAHKIRNQLAHESGFKLNSMTTNRALRYFRAGLKDLGAF